MGIDFINHVSTCSMPLTNHIGNTYVWQIGIYSITMICESPPKAIFWNTPEEEEEEGKRKHVEFSSKFDI